jgi:acetylornithine deacetylase
MTEFVADWARRQGWQVDLWQADEEELRRLGPLPPKFITLEGRPTLVSRLAGIGGGRSLIFNAHSDVVAAPNAERWRFGPWSGAVHDSKLYGRGACDTKGPLVSALWAMKAIQQAKIPLAGDLLLELIPGEEDCVGLGTLTSVARGYKSDGVIVLEPTEGIPRRASRGGLRFEIVCLGSAVHGTVKWLGQDAIALAPRVLDVLSKLEAKWNDRTADSLFDEYPLMRPITVDSLHGGDCQGMICDRCVCGGYFELLPEDDLETWGQLFIRSVLEELVAGGIGAERVSLQIVERYDGHVTGVDDPLCRAAGQGNWSAFNSGCEAGLRAKRLGTPTLVWGPGSLAQAHRVDEFVELSQVAAVAGKMAQLAVDYCGPIATTTK